MKNNTKISLLTLVIGIIGPWVTIYIYNQIHLASYQFIIQCVGLSIMLVSSLYLFFANIKASRKNIKISKLTPVFVIISIGAFFYSLIILMVTLAFRNFSGL